MGDAGFEPATPYRVKGMDMTPKPNDRAAVFDAVALERDLAKLKRPITEYRRFFVNNLLIPGAELRAVHRDHFQSDAVLYIGRADEVGEVIDMCARLNQYLRMIRTLSGGAL